MSVRSRETKSSIEAATRGGRSFGSHVLELGWLRGEDMASSGKQPAEATGLRRIMTEVWVLQVTLIR